MENIRDYVEQNSVFGGNLEYKGLIIKPITVENAKEFLSACEILSIEKNKIPDVEILQMSYLYFIFTFMINDEELMGKFLKIMELCLGLEFKSSNMQDGDFEPNEVLVKEGSDGRCIYFVNGWDIAFEVQDTIISLAIGDIVLNSTEFETLKKIILFQNIYNYDDTIMSDDFKKVVTQYYELKNKGIKMPTLEDKMMAIIVSTAYTIETIKKIPLRSFEILFDYSMRKTEYQVTMPLIPHLKSQPDHWVYRPEKERYSEVFSSAEELAHKVTSI